MLCPLPDADKRLRWAYCSSSFILLIDDALVIWVFVFVLKYMFIFQYKFRKQFPFFTSSLVTALNMVHSASKVIIQLHVDVLISCFV